MTAKRSARFIAAHRGGILTLEHHRMLAAWAANCAEHLLPLFEKQSNDNRPHLAIAAARSWAAGEEKTGFCQRASIAAHAAAREITDTVSIAIARASAHAAATAHMADHSLGVVYYGEKAYEAAGKSFKPERICQMKLLPPEIRELVNFGLLHKFPPKH